MISIVPSWLTPKTAIAFLAIVAVILWPWQGLTKTKDRGAYTDRHSERVHKNFALKAMFQTRAADCASAAMELQGLVESLGGKPKDSGTIVGAAHRGWAKVVATVGDTNLSMLEEVERAEDKALTQSSDVAHFRTDHFSESQSFGTVCGPKSISLAPELRAADAL